MLDTENRVAHRAKLTVRALPAVNAAAPSQAAAPTAATWHVGGMLTKQIPLGNQIIEGVNAEGVRLTSVIDTGAQGNDAPLTTVQEHWLAPQLSREVLTKWIDPRHGETTTRLTNIALGDPDPNLFQVPAAYQVIDETGPFSIKFNYTALPASGTPNK